MFWILSLQSECQLNLLIPIPQSPNPPCQRRFTKQSLADLWCVSVRDIGRWPCGANWPAPGFASGKPEVWPIAGRLLSESPASFVVLELSESKIEETLDFIRNWQAEFPLFRFAIVADRDLATYKWLMHEAGAVEFICSVRKNGALAQNGLPSSGPGASFAAKSH